MKKGEEIYLLMKRLFPICRSITGKGVRETLNILKEVCPSMKIYSVPSGTKVFDWTVPKEWNINDAYVMNSKGKKVIDFNKNNLHVVSYSLPMNAYMNLSELKKILHYYPENADWIPYVTSYYNETSGFCLSKKDYDALREDMYHVVIDSELSDGYLNYGEIIIPGETDKEVLFSTYICHPSMANNELSGPCIAIHLANYLLERERKYTYRFVFVPETIGSITYISRNIENLKKNVIAGYNLSCLGDDLAYTCVSTKYGNTLSDRVAQICLSNIDPNYRQYSFLKRGSDERQYNMPGVDIPVCGLYRSKSNEYDEYHTSADNMAFVKPKALNESFEMLMDIVFALEKNAIYKTTCLCEPQLGKRNLYPKTNGRACSRKSGAFKFLDLLAYADGDNDLIAIADYIKLDIRNTYDMVQKLMAEDLLELIPSAN